MRSLEELTQLQEMQFKTFHRRQTRTVGTCVGQLLSTTHHRVSRADAELHHTTLFVFKGLASMPKVKHHESRRDVGRWERDLRLEAAGSACKNDGGGKEQVTDR